MKCPFCGEMESRVIDSRLSKDGTAVRRRRECEACRKRYTTYERVENQVPMVVKKDGRREQFNRQKLLGGILKACQKRPVGIEEIERFCDELQSRIQETGEREVDSRWLGEQVMAYLQKLDEVAYVRFASVYRSFKDLRQFLNELQDLMKREQNSATEERR